MIKELEEVCEYLKVHYRYGDHTQLSEPDQWEDKPYVACDDKVINFVDGYYHISDMSDIHQTLRFKTKEEVLQFYNGHSEGYQFYFDEPKDIAFAIGKLTTIIDLMGDKETQDAFKNAISPIQKKYKDKDADAN
jgi:hypothetical protein